MKKGITPILAVIILLLVTTAIAATIWVLIRPIFETPKEQAKWQDSKMCLEWSDQNGNKIERSNVENYKAMLQFPPELRDKIFGTIDNNKLYIEYTNDTTGELCTEAWCSFGNSFTSYWCKLNVTDNTCYLKDVYGQQYFTFENCTKFIWVKEKM